MQRKRKPLNINRLKHLLQRDAGRGQHIQGNEKQKEENMRTRQENAADNPNLKFLLFQRHKRTPKNPQLLVKTAKKIPITIHQLNEFRNKERPFQ